MVSRKMPTKLIWAAVGAIVVTGALAMTPAHAQQVIVQQPMGTAVVVPNNSYYYTTVPGYYTAPVYTPVYQTPVVIAQPAYRGAVVIPDTRTYSYSPPEWTMSGVARTGGRD